MKQGINFKKQSYTKEKVLTLNRESYKKEFLEDKILSIYFHYSEFVMGMVNKWVDEAWYDLYHSMGIYDMEMRSLQSKIKTSSTLTIGQALGLKLN